jgi:hypothetical protein
LAQNLQSSLNNPLKTGFQKGEKRCFNFIRFSLQPWKRLKGPVEIFINNYLVLQRRLIMDNSYSSTGRYPPESGSAHTRAKAEQVQQEAQHFTEKVKEQGQSLLTERKQATADEIGSIAKALHKTAQEMHQQEHPPMITPYAEWAGDTLESFSNTLRERDLNTLLRQTEDFARRQPGIFVGGAVVAGFLLARFLKSSASHNEYDDTHPIQTSNGQRADYYSTTGGQHTAQSQDPEKTHMSSPSVMTTPLTGTRPSTLTVGTTTNTQRGGEL